MDFPLGSLGLQVKAHWKEHRPKMYAQLQREGKLDESVHTAEALTVAAYDQAIHAGLAPDQARELVREEWRVRDS